MDLNAELKQFSVDKEALAATVMQWSNINSHSFNVAGLERMATVLTEAFVGLGAENTILSLPPIESIDNSGMKKSMSVGPMLRFRKRPEAPVQVLLVGHMDTVFELENHFQSARRKSDNIIVGPGVADMKGGLCVMLEALKFFEKSSRTAQLGWEVLINPDEEIGSLASARFLSESAVRHQVGLLFEPAMDEQGTLAGDRKGSGKFTIVVHGQAAHAGRDFAKGRNAISLLSKIITQIDALNGIKNGVTFNVGQVQGGGSVNVVPAFSICRIDVRIVESEDAIWVRAQLDSIVTAANQQTGYQVELHGAFGRTPKRITGKTAELYRLLREVGASIGQNISWQPSGGCCDGNNLAAAGLPNIDTLGVCGGGLHSDQEYMLVDSLVSRTKLIAAVLLRLSEAKL